MYKYSTPQELFIAICDKIRDKSNSNELINHQDIPDKIDSLVSSDIINEYNELLSIIINQDTIIELNNNNKIENINICFIGCTSLTTIDLPECTSIGDSAFYDCPNLTTVNLPKCTSIGNKAFEGCTNLTTVNLPECTSIEGWAFNRCTNLTTVNLPECTSIGDGAFHRCTNLTIINLPECTSIGNYAFRYCPNLTTVNLPKCTSIGNEAFYGCTKMINVYLEGDSFIGDDAFRNCEDLRNVYILASHVTTLGANVFDNTPITGYGGKTGYIYVPDNLVNSYKSDTKWSTYADRIRSMNEA